MCDFEVGYTTLVGPLNELEDVVEHWREVTETQEPGGLSFPQIHSLSHLAGFEKPTCPAVAVVAHDPRLGTAVADRLQVELYARSARNHAPAGWGVVCEAGFVLVPASSLPGKARPSVTLDSGRLQQAASDSVRLRQAATAPQSGYGSRVAVLDSGDVSAPGTMTDFLQGFPQTLPADDEIGHGTAVAGIIRALRPNAQIDTIRVINAQGRAESSDLLLGLVYALWPGSFDVVNVSMTNQIAGNCATGLGKSLTYILRLCQTLGQGARTTLVAAAGNDNSGQYLGYPALLPGAEIATGLDWNGDDAGYNVSTRGASERTRPAFGGTEIDPFGYIVDQASSTPIFGTSYAAAVVTASHLA